MFEGEAEMKTSGRSMAASLRAAAIVVVLSAVASLALPGTLLAATSERIPLFRDGRRVVACQLSPRKRGVLVSVPRAASRRVRPRVVDLRSVRKELSGNEKRQKRTRAGAARTRLRRRAALLRRYIQAGKDCRNGVFDSNPPVPEKPLCENGRFDAGEEGIDCGGVCTACTGTKAIANWDVVPFQLFSDEFRAGVVGFHETGLTVAFEVNGRKSVAAEPSWNPATRAYEYQITLRASDYPDGAVQISAVALPKGAGHRVRELSPLVLYANAGGSLTNSAVAWADCSSGSDTGGDGSEQRPYQSLSKAFVSVGAGGTVYLKSGECYSAASHQGRNYQYWTTIEPAPGVPRSAIKIKGGRFGENMVRWHNVQLYKDTPSPAYSTIFYFESNHRVWLDGCELYDALGRWNGGDPFNGNRPFFVYETGTLIRDIMNAGGRFKQNCEVRNIGSDVFRGASDLLSVNLTVNGIDPGSSGAHPDFIQFYNPGSTVENVILYNSKVYNMGAQGIFGSTPDGPVRDFAVVNLLMEKLPANSYAISQSGYIEHALIWHVTSAYSGWLLRYPETLKLWDVRNNIFATFSPAGGNLTGLADSLIARNLFASLVWDQPVPMGSQAIVGSPVFADAAGHDFRLQQSSPAAAAGAPLPGVPADVDGNLYDPVHPSLGAFQWREEG